MGRRSGVSCLFIGLVAALGHAPHTLAAAIEEIVVTAQKRPERALDVPISLSVMTAPALEASGIQRMDDLRGFIPNLSITREPIGDKLNLRGMQSGNQAGFEQSVATFVDGIYRGRGMQSRYAFLDVDRVEVLRGPQATLFGQNTLAGAVKIDSAAPTDEREASISATQNLDFDETELQAIASGALSDQLRGRVVVLDRQRDKGHVFNSFYAHDVPQSDETAARVTLVWQPDAVTELTFRTERGAFTIVGQPWELLRTGTLAASGAEAVFDYRTAAGASDPVMDFGANGMTDGDLRETLLGVAHELASGHRLSLLAGHSAYQFERFLDPDISTLDALRYDDTEDFNQRSIELRFSSEENARVEYMAGVYAQHQDLVADGLTYFSLRTIAPVLTTACERALRGLTANASGFANVAVPGNAAGTAANVARLIGAGGGQGAGVAFNCAQAAAFAPAVNQQGLAGINRYSVLDQEARTWAAFVQGTWHLSEAWSLAGGLRYNDEIKRAAQSAWTAPFGERSTQAVTSPVLAALGESVGEFTTHRFTPISPGMKRRDDNLSWSASLRRHLGDDSMLYLGAGRGYKSGGFNSFYMGQPRGLGANSRDAGFEDESALSVELGFKTVVFDGAGEVNAALFRTRFDDLQVSLFTGSTNFIVQNAASAISQGLEVDTRWAFGARTQLRAAVGYLDFTFRDFPRQACVAEQFVTARQAAYVAGLQAAPAAAAAQALGYTSGSCALAGINDMRDRASENSPRLQASLSLNYRQPLPRGFELTWNADVNWRDGLYRQGDLDPVSRVGANTRANLSLALEPADARWTLALLVRNVTDTDEILFVNDLPLFTGARLAHSAEPRSTALRAVLRF